MTTRIIAGTSSEIKSNKKSLLEHFFFFPKRKPVLKEKGI
jgi:hypothetical protein